MAHWPAWPTGPQGTLCENVLCNKFNGKCPIKEATNRSPTTTSGQRAEACDILTLRWGVYCNGGSLTYRIWDAHDGKNADTKRFYNISAYSKQMSIEWMMTENFSAKFGDRLHEQPYESNDNVTRYQF